LGRSCVRGPLRACCCVCAIHMEDEFEDFSVSSPFEALVADIQEVQPLPPFRLRATIICN
jgi:hypothetical protein